MPRQLLPIRFADLRRLAREVPVYLAAQSYVSETPALAAGVEDELGLAGPDTAELILRFAEAYNVELASTLRATSPPRNLICCFYHC